MKDMVFVRLEKNNLSSVYAMDKDQMLDSELENFLSNKNQYYFVGICENIVIAVLYGYGLIRPDGKHMFYIHSVDVSPKFQNQGIGTRLMEYVLNYINKENVFYKFFILAEPDNIRACKVYQKYGDKNIQVLFSKNFK